MRTRRFVVSLIVLLAVTAGWAAKGTPLTANFWSQTGFGVTGDANGSYIQGVGGIQAYFGVAGKDLDLVTYSTARTLHFSFDPSATAVISAGLPATFNGQVDFYGVNYYGTFASMGVGTTAQLNTSLQFKTPGGVTTYELAYQSLAVKRLSANTWHVTSNPDWIGGNPGFTTSSQAQLSMIRKRGSIAYGAVNMPIDFDVALN